MMELPEHGATVRKGDDALADGIGSLIINFALFNAHLNGALSALLRLNLQQARGLVVPMMPRAKLEMVQSYTKLHWSQKDAREVKHICKLGLDLTDYRNNIAHGDMILSDPDGEVHLAIYKGASRFSPKLVPIPAAEVAHNAMHAMHLAREFRALGLCIAQGETFEARRPPPEADK